MRAGEARSVCPARSKPWVLAVAILGSSLAFLEGSVVMLALPAVQREFGLATVELQWVVNAYLLILSSFMLLAGAAADRIGLKAVFASGGALFGAGALAASLAPTFAALVSFRFLQGAGAALMVPASLALISAHFTKQERGKAIGTWAGVSALTTAGGPVLGGWLVDMLSWRAVFYIIPPLAAVLIAATWWRVPEVDKRADERAQGIDYGGGVLLTIGLGMLTYGLMLTSEDANGALDGRIVLLASLATLIWFVYHERRAAAPMMPLALFSSVTFSGANGLTLLLYFALSGAFYLLPLNLIQVQGWSASEAGAALLPFTLVMGLGSRVAGGLLEQVPARLLLSAGPCITALGYALLILPGRNAAYFTEMLPGLTLLGVGMTISVAPLTTVVMNAVPERRAGVASGINNTAARLAGLVAVAVLTSVAVRVFSDRLAIDLAERGVHATFRAGLLQDAARLAELEPPAGVERDLARQIDAAVDTAFVAAFRWAMAACAAAAAASGMIGWFTAPSIPGARRRSKELSARSPIR